MNVYKKIPTFFFLSKKGDHYTWNEIDLENTNKKYVQWNWLWKYDFALKVEVNTNLKLIFFLKVDICNFFFLKFNAGSPCIVQLPIHIQLFTKFWRVVLGAHNCTENLYVANNVVSFNWDGWCKYRGAIQLKSATCQCHYVHVFVYNYVHQAFFQFWMLH